VEDISNATFKVRGSLTLTAPNGGEAWKIGTVQRISWTRTGTISLVELRYSIDSGATFTTVITASTDGLSNYYDWTVPDSPSSTVQVKIIDKAYDTVIDTSDANFKIIGSVTVTAPNGGEEWGIDLAKTITWAKTGSIANVKIQYSPTAAPAMTI
jgi:hypothetical protein